MVGWAGTTGTRVKGPHCMRVWASIQQAGTLSVAGKKQARTVLVFQVSLQNTAELKHLKNGFSLSIRT